MDVFMLCDSMFTACAEEKVDKIMPPPKKNTKKNQTSLMYSHVLTSFLDFAFYIFLFVYYLFWE